MKPLVGTIDNSSSLAGNGVSKSDRGVKVSRRGFSFVSWNTQGLIEHRLKLRTSEICRLLLEEYKEPHVIHLQEIVPESEELFRKAMPQYTFVSALQLSGRDHYYHVMTGVHKRKCQLVDMQLIPFPNTIMGRKMLITKVNLFNGNNPDEEEGASLTVKFINTHLESLPRYLHKRLWQLKRVFDEMGSREPTILAGDLNIKDYEIHQTDGVPSHIRDAWVSCGSDPAEENSWHHVNQTYNAEIFPDTRFDRIYYSGDGLHCQSFKLIPVRQMVPGEKMSHTSDHDGLLAHFRI